MNIQKQSKQLNISEKYCIKFMDKSTFDLILNSLDYGVLKKHKKWNFYLPKSLYTKVSKDDTIEYIVGPKSVLLFNPNANSKELLASIELIRRFIQRSLDKAQEE